MGAKTHEVSGAGRLALLAALIAAVALAPAAAEAKKVVKGPDGEAFYKPPKKLPKGHGKLIWHRKAPNLVASSDHARTDRVLYTSKSPQGERVAVSGSVSVPKGKPPKGGWPVITLGSRHDRDRRRLRALEGRGRHRLLEPFVEHVGQGRLRGRPHRLPGPRHTRSRTPI